MLEHLKERLKEIVALAESVPEKYQQKCFELLLQNLLAIQAGPVVQPAASATREGTSRGAGALPEVLAKLGITQADFEKVYHKEDGTYAVIVQDLKVKPNSQKQMRLALLLGIKNLAEGAEAAVLRDALIELCKRYAAYDNVNFSTYMKKNKQVFVAKGDGWVLTVPGQQKAAQLIKELAQ